MDSLPATTPRAICGGSGRRAASRLKSSRQLAVERLEDRTLMAVSLIGMPTWVEQGPGPIVNGQAQGLTDNNPVTGAVEAAAVRPGTPTTILIGSTDGWDLAYQRHHRLAGLLDASHRPDAFVGDQLHRLQPV